MTRIQSAIARVFTLLGTLFFGLWAIAQNLLAFLGATTADDDLRNLIARLPRWAEWLFSTPWWVPTALAILLTFFLIWLSWPRESEKPIVTIASHNSENSENSSTSDVKNTYTATRKLFQNERLRPWDLNSGGSHLIRDKIFIDCVIEGPAVIGFISNIHMDNIILETENIDHNIIIIENDRLVVGIYGFQGCRFEGCTFIKIGIAATERDARMFKGKIQRSE